MVGNRDREVPPMGWTFPLPEDDTWSCEGTEEHSLGHLVEQDNFVDEAMEPPPHHQWIHLTNADTGTYRNTCEGEISQQGTGFSDDTPHGIAVLPQAQQLLPIQVLHVLGKTHAAILWSYHTIAQLKGP